MNAKDLQGFSKERLRAIHARIHLDFTGKKKPIEDIVKDHLCIVNELQKHNSDCAEHSELDEKSYVLQKQAPDLSDVHVSNITMAFPPSGFTADTEKASKSVVDYKEADSTQRCGVCAFFVSAKPVLQVNFCTLVEGSIEPSFVCSLFRSKPKLAKEIKFDVNIFAKSDEKQILYGIVVRPNEFDSQGDSAEREATERAMHGFMASGAKVGLLHKSGPEGVIDATVVENWMQDGDKEFEGTLLKDGDWVMGVHVADKPVWERTQTGELGAFSIQGIAIDWDYV